MVNVIAPIFTEPGKGAYKQSIYHPFRDISVYGRGTALQPVVNTENKVTKYGEVPSVIFASTLSEDESEITLFALNTSKREDSETTIDLSSFGKTEMIARSELSGDDLSAKNSLEEPEKVSPKTAALVQDADGKYTVSLKKASWNVLRFNLK